jgi:hypothetical protein
MANEDHMIDFQQAANILEISRASFVKLLESGAMPHQRSENQRGVLLSDVLAFAKKRDGERRAALDRLSQAAVNADLYDRNVFPEGGQDE